MHILRVGTGDDQRALGLAQRLRETHEREGCGAASRARQLGTFTGAWKRGQ